MYFALSLYLCFFLYLPFFALSLPATKAIADRNIFSSSLSASLLNFLSLSIWLSPCNSINKVFVHIYSGGETKSRLSCIVFTLVVGLRIRIRWIFKARDPDPFFRVWSRMLELNNLCCIVFFSEDPEPADLLGLWSGSIFQSELILCIYPFFRAWIRIR